MNFNPDGYPGEYPEEWYETPTGKIVGHVSLLRDMIQPDIALTPEDTLQTVEAMPKIYFSLGSWEEDEWVDGVAGGRGVVLGLDEESDMPRVVIGDFELLEEMLDDPDDAIVVERDDLKEIPLDQIGYIFGLSVPLEETRGE